MVTSIKKPLWLWLGLVLVLALTLKVWTHSGYQSVTFDTDLGRDLKEISNIQRGQLVWLGPRLDPGLNASSSYYYLFYPAVALSGGQVESMVTFNIILAMASIVFYGYLATKKYGLAGTLSTLIVSLAPMATQHALHAGNGYSHIWFMIAGLTALWFELPLVIAAGLIGFAFALHPTAGCLVLLLVWEWWRRGHNWKSGLLSAVAFAVPLAPSLAFEVITKGYMWRSFVANPHPGTMEPAFGWLNLVTSAQLTGFKLWLVIILIISIIIVIWKRGNFKDQSWLAVTAVSFVPLLFISHLFPRYLFGYGVLLVFLMAISLAQYAKVWVISALGMWLLLHSPLLYPYPVANRQIPKIESAADFMAQNLIAPGEKVAVVAATSPKTEVPQADDYRFLLRNRGIEVVEITQQADAETLVMVVEVPNFNWSKWNNWEIESFGQKVVKQVSQYQDFTIITFSK